MNTKKKNRVVARFMSLGGLKNRSPLGFIEYLGEFVFFIVFTLLDGLRRAFLSLLKRAAKKILPLFKASHASQGPRSKSAVKIASGFRRFLLRDRLTSAKITFSRRKKKYGAIRATALLLSDIVCYIKKSDFNLKSAVSLVAPVLACAGLAFAVNTVTTTGMGVSIISNGEQIGIVSVDSVIDDATKVLNNRIAYMDTGATPPEVFVTARLEITPLSGNAQVMDSAALADAISQNGDLIVPTIEAFEPVLTPPAIQSAPVDADPGNVISPETAKAIDGKIKAYGVTINGEFWGAIDEPMKITSYLNDLKAPYEAPDVTSLSFDKEIVYDYEQFYFPYEIKDEQLLLDRLSGTAKEAVYITVELDDSPWSMAMANDMSLDEFLECPITDKNGKVIEDMTKKFPVGARIQLSADVPYLSVLVTKPLTYTVDIPFKTEASYDSSMFKGKTTVTSRGKVGSETVEAEVTYRNGTIISRNILSRTQTLAPVTQYEIIGTKEPKTYVSTNGGSGEYHWPVEGGYISAYMGDRRGHQGLDIAAPYGTNIYAAANGTITRIGDKGDGYGKAIFVANDDGFITVYGHMSKTADFAKGDYVVKGQLIGFVGSTGRSTGNHLHFEIRSSYGYEDPMDYVSQP
ncbi:MAG: peptidoglycan DD-metalloendopeptidase family protein [Ruminococcus sp.]|nr:peptidoglycan DD-metalloendopeptidase family protein [Ruminococcus sp.]